MTSEQHHARILVVDDDRDTLRLAERLRLAAAASPINFRSNNVEITIRAGVAERRAPRRGPEDLPRAADEALFQAKEAGRNQEVAKIIFGVPVVEFDNSEAVEHHDLSFLA